jgi:hypothetical protein
MYTRLLLGMAAFPLLAQQDGCTKQDVTNIMLVVLQSLVATLLPLLIEAMLGGAVTGY